MWKYLHGGKNVEVFLTDILLNDMATMLNIYQGDKTLEQTLMEKQPSQGQSPFLYIYQLLELTKLAYPMLSERDQVHVAGGYFVESQAGDVRRVLREMRARGEVTLIELAGEVTRLQSAVKSGEDNGVTNVIMEVNDVSLKSVVNEAINTINGEASVLTDIMKS